MESGQRTSNRYELVRRVGTDPLAITYLAKDLALERSVVVKTLRSEFLSQQETIHRFQQEAQRIATLSHRNLVAIREVGLDDGLPYLVAEYLPAGSLRDRLALSKPVPIDDALDIAVGVAAALGVYHAQNLVHGDLRPGNVMFDEDENVKVSDGGMRRVLASAHVAGHRLPRQLPTYVSPEEASGQLPTPASDVYSVGIMLHVMLTGQHPHGHPFTTKPVPLTPRRAESLVPAHIAGVPPSLARIVHQMMSVDPRDRYASAQQLHRILLGYQRERRGPSPHSMPTDGETTDHAEDENGHALPMPVVNTDAIGVTSSDTVEQKPGMDWPFLILALLAVAAILGLVLLWTAIHRQYTLPLG